MPLRFILPVLRAVRDTRLGANEDGARIDKCVSDARVGGPAVDDSSDSRARSNQVAIENG